MSFLERFAKPVKDERGKGYAAPDPWLTAFPAISEFLTADVYPGKEKRIRQGSTLLIFCEDGQYKVCLGERDNDLSLWGTGKSLETALETLEGQLASDCPPWRAKKKPKK